MHSLRSRGGLRPGAKAGAAALESWRERRAVCWAAAVLVGPGEAAVVWTELVVVEAWT